MFFPINYLQLHFDLFTVSTTALLTYLIYLAQTSVNTELPASAQFSLSIGLHKHLLTRMVILVAGFWTVLSLFLYFWSHLGLLEERGVP